MASIRLVALKCIRCGTPVPAEPGEVAWVCAQCGQGLLLDEEHGLVALEVQFAGGASSKEDGYPFWVVDGLVTMRRETYSVVGKKTGEAQRFWDPRHRFSVPAFDAPLDRLIGLGVTFLDVGPQPGAPIPFVPITLPPRDVPAMVDFIVMAIEAERSDKVKQIEFAVELGTPELWIIPL